MGMHTQDVTVVGWVGSDLRTYHLDGVGGVPYTQFRLASTRRVLDRQTGAFRDGPTLWFTVKAWRTAAVNLEASLVKGDPVVVVGRLGQSEWVAQDGSSRSELVLEALTVGHDLGYGTAKFRRTTGGTRRGREDAMPRGAGDDEQDDELVGTADGASVAGGLFTDDPWAGSVDVRTAGEPAPDGAEVDGTEEAEDLAVATAGRG